MIIQLVSHGPQLYGLDKYGTLWEYDPVVRKWIKRTESPN